MPGFQLNDYNEFDITSCMTENETTKYIEINGIASTRDTSLFVVEIYVVDIYGNNGFKTYVWHGVEFKSENLYHNGKEFFFTPNTSVSISIAKNYTLKARLKCITPDVKPIAVFVIC